ncbi:MAG: hypothetical protein GY771_09055 [bacterium]|nr:hypothetical protein [bacterium]
MRYVILTVTLTVFATGAIALNVGDTQPGLDGPEIDDSADYLGPVVDIQTYLDNGNVIVVTHWKQS